jgi:hypothetical protein
MCPLCVHFFKALRKRMTPGVIHEAALLSPLVAGKSVFAFKFEDLFQCAGQEVHVADLAGILEGAGFGADLPHLRFKPGELLLHQLLEPGDRLRGCLLLDFLLLCLFCRNRGQHNAASPGVVTVCHLKTHFWSMANL